MKQLGKYAAAFLITVCAAVALLFAGACLPQSAIDENVKISAEQLYQEGVYPVIGDKSFAGMLDNYTESLILAESKAMSIREPETVFTNPLFTYWEDAPMEDLVEYANDGNPTPSSFYVRYWMGFRWLIRLALTFLDYCQIRRYIAFAVVSLMAAVMCSIAKRTDTKLAFLFALSVILVRPYMIANCMQFSCCFLIAFVAMLEVPWVYENPKWERLFFMELGMITMYFDFYTVPLITFGLPLVYLYALRGWNGESMKLKTILKDLAVWFLAYGLMWLAKLVLTSLFTSVDALSNGFNSLFGRLGVTRTEGYEDYYSPYLALRNVFLTIAPDKEGIVVFALGAAAVLGCFLFRAKRRGLAIENFLEEKNLILVALLPVIWFVATAQPIAIHHWFQYRTIALSYWAAGVYMVLTLRKEHRQDPA